MMTQEDAIQIAAEHLSIAVMLCRDKTQNAFRSDSGPLLGLSISSESAIQDIKDLINKYSG